MEDKGLLKLGVHGKVNIIMIHVRNVVVLAMLNVQTVLDYLAEAAESVKSAKDLANWSVANVTDLAK